MNYKVDDIAASFVSVLAGSGFKIGDSAMPEPNPGVDEPYAILYLTGGGESYGSMAGAQEMNKLTWQLKVVGHTAEQCRKLVQKLHTLMDTGWDSVTGCIGPVTVTSGGIVEEDQKTFVSNESIYMEVSG
jgi:hypothetical protein